MDRRNFLRNLIGGVGVGAAVRTFPFRVFSFPTEIRPMRHLFMVNGSRIDFLDLRYWGVETMRSVDAIFQFGSEPEFGTRLDFKLPKRSMVVTSIDQTRGEITLAPA